MTANILLDELTKTLRDEVFFDLRLNNGQGKLVPINLFKHNLPEVVTDDDADEMLQRVPYCIARVTDINIASWEAPTLHKVLLIFGILDMQPEQDGHQTILDLITRVNTYFSRRPYLGKCFEITPPIDAAVQDTDTNPYYIGAMTMMANGPAVRQESDYI